jgi:hypothetical protein
MFIRLTRATRLRVAATLALAYAFCVLAPPVALAYLGGEAFVHCLTARHEHRTATAHAESAAIHSHHAANHDHGAGDVKHLNAHHHKGDPVSGQAHDSGTSTAASCCGVFCISALPTSLSPDLLPTARILSTLQAVDRGIAGRSPGRIDRPPSLLPQL